MSTSSCVFKTEVFMRPESDAFLLLIKSKGSSRPQNDTSSRPVIYTSTMGSKVFPTTRYLQRGLRIPYSLLNFCRKIAVYILPFRETEPSCPLLLKTDHALHTWLDNL